MGITTLSSSPATAQISVHPPDGGTPSTRAAADANSVRPASIEHNAAFHPFYKGETIQPLSQAERARVTTALKTGIAWLEQAISSLSKPFSQETKELLSSLIPGGLQTEADKEVLKNKLIQTMTGMQKMRDDGASNVCSAMNIPGVAAVTSKNTGQMHISRESLADKSDTALAAVLVHEASHAYAKTDDNWVLTPHATTNWDRLKGLLSSAPTARFDQAAPNGGVAAPFTFENSVNNAYTVQYAVEVLAGRSYDALE
jgi:hypothetical protein